MKRLIDIYNETSLILRIIIGLISGILLGCFFPYMNFMEVLGKLFVGALKGIAPILVFVLIVAALAKEKEKLDKKFSYVIFLYLISTFCASFTAIIGSFIFPQTLVLDGTVSNDGIIPTGIFDVITNLLYTMVENPLEAIQKGQYTGILFWSIIFGIGLKNVACESTKKLISDVQNAVSNIVASIINLAPFGIMGLVYTSVSTSGLSIFTTYGKLVLLLVSCMLVSALVINPFIVFLALRINPYPLVLKCIIKSGTTAFFVRSSAANIPVNMALCEELELDKKMYAVSIPLGATINMNGAAVTVAVMTLAAVHTVGVSVDLISAFLLSLLGAIAACGASGIAGGSLLLIPMTCSLFGISQDIAMQVVAVGFVIGVIQDSFETALNSSGDVLFAATAEYKNWKKIGKKLPDFLCSDKK